MPNEKSSSWLSSKRFFWASVHTEYASALVSAGVSGGRPGSAWSLPWTRTAGGLFVVRCRSEPSSSTVFRSKSGNLNEKRIFQTWANVGSRCIGIPIFGCLQRRALPSLHNLAISTTQGFGE